jgi:hypothetical protein
MTGKRGASAVLILLTLACFGFTRLSPALLPNADAAGGQLQFPADDGGIPSYHAYVLLAPYPPTVNPRQFSDGLAQNAYRMASKIKPVLFQQPCYCHCDRNMGHKSLLDCYGGTHAAVCDVCLKEAIFTYEQTSKGKTPAQIRTAIIRGDWQAVNMQPYSKTIEIR